MRILRFFFLLIVLLALAVGVGGWWGIGWYRAPGPLAQAVTIVLPKGGGIAGTARTLAEAGIVENVRAFEIAARLTESNGEIKTGEYAVPAAITPEALLALIRSGKTIVHRITIPEGLTTAQIMTLIDGAEALQGTVAKPPGEGELFPSTYFYPLGESRQALVDQMRRTMDRTLAELWAARAADLPLTDPHAALTLASIVEKETSVEAERPKIAGVFYNRLKLGMRLQSDPTVIYALTGGKEPLGRPLAKSDLGFASPYNTYAADGLPPGPIGNPGRAALAAVLNPEATDALYFVADGTGGHAFAATLDAHNKNVQNWRKHEAAAQK